MFSANERSRFLIRLVDDEADVLNALQLLLECAGWRTKAYAHPEDFLKEPDSFTPGCIVLDMLMPGMNGLALQHELLLRGIKLPIIFVTGHATVDSAVGAFRKGAVHYLQKPVEAKELFAAIDEACALYSAEHAEVPLDEAKIRSAFEKLTARQRQVLLFVLQGLQSREIGERLGISHRTVLGHRAALNRIFGIHAQTEFNKLAEILRPFIHGGDHEV